MDPSLIYKPPLYFISSIRFKPRLVRNKLRRQEKQEPGKTIPVQGRSHV